MSNAGSVTKGHFVRSKKLICIKKKRQLSS